MSRGDTRIRDFWTCPIERAARNFVDNPLRCPYCGFSIEGLISEREEPYYPMAGGVPFAYEIYLGPPELLAARVKEFKDKKSNA